MEKVLHLTALAILSYSGGRQIQKGEWSLSPQSEHLVPNSEKVKQSQLIEFNASSLLLPFPWT